MARLSPGVFDARVLRHRRDLVLELVKRDMRLRYKRSIVGLGWSMLNPLLQFVTFYAVFRYILPVGREHFALFLFPGLLAWNWLQTSLQLGCTAIVDHASLLRQPGFPTAALPLATVIASLVHFLLALPIAIAAALWTGTISIVALLGLPLVIGVQFLVIACAVYIAAALHVAFRDTQYLIGVAMLIGFYASPILYAPADVPAAARTIYWLNPMVAILEGYHQIFVDGRFPAVMPLAIVGALAAAALAFTYARFIAASRWFVEELG